MQGNMAEIIRELMDLQKLSVRKVSARIAEKHGGSIYGYTQQISRILNDPDYDPSLSTVQKILSALNVSFVQVSTAPGKTNNTDLTLLITRMDQLSHDVADLKLGMVELQKTIGSVLQGLSPNQPS